MVGRALKIAVTFVIVLACALGRSSAAPLDDVLRKSDGFLGNASATSNASEDEPIVNVSFAPVNAPEGREALLKIELIVPEGRHTYSTNKNFSGGTKITINAVKGITPIDTEFVADHKPKLEYEPLFSKTVEKYKGRVTWTRRFKIDPEISPDDAGLVFYFRFQTCNSTNCKNKTIFYQATLSDITTIKSLKFATLAGATPYQEPDAPAPTVIDDADVTAGTNDPFFSDLQFVDDEAGGDLAWFLFSAFIGGMILNVMPCVLPVLAIKILSFVQQAGESRLRIFLLNLSYTGGVLSVFLLLATLAVTVNLGWGGLFQNSDFNLVMACLVFAMGLSLLGVFEIPVPGFVGSAAGNSQQQEGLAGAFLTGIFATLLATPCSGPFLGATLGDRDYVSHLGNDGARDGVSVFAVRHVSVRHQMASQAGNVDGAV